MRPTLRWIWIWTEMETETETTGSVISGGHKKCTLARMTKRAGGAAKDPYPGSARRADTPT